jgi:all-trans-8'-apo-beta-carotenal 15,15'-oxygenase
VGVAQGQVDQHLFDEGQRPSEPIFVPRAESGPEGDGHLLTLVYDPKTHRSHVAVLDAQRLGAGPVARAFFDHHVPMTFHGLWWPGA